MSADDATASAAPTAPTAPDTPAAHAAPAAPVTLSLEFISTDARDAFDATVREISGVITPPPGISDALLATILGAADDGSAAALGTAGVAYIQVRHVVSPLIVAEDAPADTIARMLEVFTDQLRAHVREAVLTAHADSAGADAPEEHGGRGLSYDVYVPDGQGQPWASEPPEGYELLPIRVWRRRVC